MKSIGQYEIIGILGRGGMGTVYKVRLPRLDKIAALKCLEPNPRLIQLLGEDRLRERFAFEAKLIANLRHPNITDVWGLEEADGRLCYLMEYFCHNLGTVIGETYWADSPSRMIRIQRAVRYTEEILEGLSRIHAAGIIHRDIKPFNIMLTDQDSVKIADFGLAKIKEETANFPEDLFIGTKGYAAPEQAASPDTADIGADIYSAGVILYRMITGRLPQNPVIAPSRLNRDTDSDWDAFIFKAIAETPEKRFSDASVMSEGLRMLYQRFIERKEKSCPIIENPIYQTDFPKTFGLRSEGVSVSAENAQTVFNLNELWRPLDYIPNRLKLCGNGTIQDDATGLIWQQSGSEYPMTLDQTQAYIRALNESRSRDTLWRLPTIEELMSLLIPPPPAEDFCFESVFNSRQKWVWSSDRRSFKSAWYVNVEMGFVASHDNTGFLYVKAVRGAES